MSRINISNDPGDFERYKIARQRLREEVTHRREQQWKVFNWASTILLGTFAGLVALSEKGFEFSLEHKLVLSVAVFALALFSSLRIRHDAGVAEGYTIEIARLDRVVDLEFDDREYKRRHIRHVGFIWMLFFGVAFMIWLAPGISNSRLPPPSNKGMHPAADTKAVKYL